MVMFVIRIREILKKKHRTIVMCPKVGEGIQREIQSFFGEFW